MAVLVRNVSAGSDVSALNIPTRKNGDYYRFEMICDGGWSRVYDDTANGLLGHLIPGYIGPGTPTTRMEARIRHAVDTQTQLQAKLNHFFADTPTTPAEQQVLTSPRYQPPILTEWDSPVPLVLVDAFYQPHGSLPKPTSGIADVLYPPNLWWLTPAEGELEYLQSLHDASVISLNIARDEVI